MSVTNGPKEKKQVSRETIVGWVVIAILLICVTVLMIFAFKLENQLTDLQSQQQMQQEVHSEQIATLSNDISTVRDDMETSFKDQQELIEKQQEQLNTQKNVQHNTIQAVIKANRKLEEKESEIQELREELKK